MRALTRGALGMFAVSVAASVTAGGCGRYGYDEITTGDDDVDGGVDTPVDRAGDFTATPCDTPVLVAQLGAPSASPPPRYALDVTATATGMVAVYQLGHGALYATGIAVDDTGAIENIQTRGHVVDTATADFSAAALGDLVQLGVADDANARMALLDLSEYGYGNGDIAYVDTKLARGHNFIVADPADDQFVVIGVHATDAYRFTVDHDGDMVDEPYQIIVGDGSLVPESVGAVKHGAGFAAYAGTSSQCKVGAFHDDWTLDGTLGTVAMTCHNLSIASAPSSSNVVAGWNCDNDQVWTTAGNVSVAALPAERSVFGDSTMIAANPRVAATSAGVWYAYAVAGGRLGRTLLDASGASVPSIPPSDVYASSRVVAHDLISRDNKAFLLWVEHGAPEDELYVMRLCTP
jgi:hypothetical protein